MKNLVAIKETTVWTTDYQPNHTYLYDKSGGKIWGYMSKGTFNPIYLKTPMNFNKKGRTFKEVSSPFDHRKI